VRSRNTGAADLFLFYFFIYTFVTEGRNHPSDRSLGITAQSRSRIQSHRITIKKMPKSGKEKRSIQRHNRRANAIKRARIHSLKSENRTQELKTIVHGIGSCRIPTCGKIT
jgi:hypothetical protein